MDNKKATLELGTEPVGKLLARYALPAIIAMTAASLYNIIDRVFIGQVVGPLAISGLAITFPFMNLAAAFGAAVGVGASTTISVRLGQRDYDAAENILGNTITLNLIIGIGFGLFSLIFLDPILRFFGASDDTLPYAHDFMTIILAGNVISHMYFGMNAVLRAASKPKEGYGGYALHCRDERCLGCRIYPVVALGYQRCSIGNHDFAVVGSLLADEYLCQSEGIAPPETWNL